MFIIVLLVIAGLWDEPVCHRQRPDKENTAMHVIKSEMASFPGSDAGGDDHI